MAKTSDVVTNFFAHTSKAQKDIKKLKDELKGLQKTTSKKKPFTLFGKNMEAAMGASSGLSGMTGGATYKLNGLLRMMKAVPGPTRVFTAAVLALGFAFTAAFKVASDMEGSIVTMSTIMGSKTRAFKEFKNAVTFSRNTPFMVSETVAALRQLTTYGKLDVFSKNLDSSKKGIKNSMMDIASAFGSIQDMSGKKIGMARVIQGLMTGNRKMTRPYFGLIQDAWNQTKTQAKQGTKLWGTLIMKNISKIPRIMELAKNQAYTMSGMFSTIAGYATEVGIAFTGVGQSGGITMWSKLKEIVRDIRDGLQGMLLEVAPILTSLGTSLGSALKSVWDALVAIWTIIQPIVQIVWVYLKAAFVIIFEVLSGIFHIVGAIFEGFGEIVSAVFHLLGITSSVNEEVAWMNDLLKKTTGFLQVFFQMLGLGLKFMFQEAGTWIRNIPDMLVNAFQTAIGTIINAWYYLQDLIVNSTIGKKLFSHDLVVRAADDRKRAVDAYAKGGYRGVYGEFTGAKSRVLKTTEDYRKIDNSKKVVITSKEVKAQVKTVREKYTGE